MASKGNRRGKRHRRQRAVRDADERFGPDQSVTVYTFPDGWTIRHPLTIQDQWREGTLTKNCLEDQTDYAAMAGDRAHEFKGLTDESVYSLRDPANFPHVTIEMSVAGEAWPWGAAQTFPPKDSYVARVRQWLATFDNPPQVCSPFDGAPLPAQTGEANARGLSPAFARDRQPKRARAHEALGTQLGTRGPQSTA